MSASICMSVQKDHTPIQKKINEEKKIIYELYRSNDDKKI